MPERSETMDCQQVRDWILEADDLLAERPTAVAAHLRDCVACRRVADQLVQLEATWRAMPPPAEAERAKQVFLARLASSPMPPRAIPSRTMPRMLGRRRLLQWCAGSAAGLLAVGGGGWLFFSGRQAQADDDLLDHLVDWNLQIGAAQSPAERAQLYNDQADRLRSDVAQTHLSGEEAVLARDCLDNGTWMVSHNDPIFEADRFAKLADRLLQLADAADTARNPRRVNRLLGQYNRLLESGIDAKIELAEASGALDFEHQGKLERLILGDTQRMQKLAELLERSPHASRKEIERALHVYHRRQKKHHHGQAARNTGKS